MTDLVPLPRRLSLWTAILTPVLALVSLGMAITTLPRSGPYCQTDCVGYPYTDVAAYVPRDYLWIYPAVVLTLMVVVLIECIRYWTPSSRQILSRIGIAFTIMGAAILVIDYASQLSFIQAALLLGETEGLSPWSQYNPHGIFITFENVGYVLLNLAFIFIGVAIVRMPSKLWRITGWVFAVSGALTLSLLLLYSAFYGIRLDYRFEVASISITWLVLIIAPVLLAIALLRAGPIKDGQVASWTRMGSSSSAPVTD
jgi:hypothetical protein